MVTIKEIREIGQRKTREERAKESEYCIHALRKVSPYFTKFFIEHNLSANQISFCSIILGSTGNFLFALGNYYLILVGCLLYQFWLLFDLVDGEIARVTNVKTLGGKYLETINEVITECGFIASLGIGLSHIHNDNAFTFIGLIFALFICLLNFFARTRDMTIEQSGRKKEKNVAPKKTLYVKRFYKKARSFFVIMNAHLVLTAIVILELILPIKFSHRISGETFVLNILSIYFLFYGLIWIVRTIVSSVTNYRHLMKN